MLNLVSKEKEKKTCNALYIDEKKLYGLSFIVFIYTNNVIQSTCQEVYDQSFTSLW